MNILLYSSGSAGDILPFIRTGHALKLAGHNVTLLTHFGYAGLAADVGIGYVPIDNETQYRRFLGDVALLNTPRTLPEFLRNHCFAALPYVLDLIREHSTPDTLLITPPLYDTVARFARECEGLSTMWAHIAPVQATAWRLLSTLFAKVLRSDIEKMRQHLGLMPITDWEQWLGFSSPSLGLWPEWFAGPEPDWLPGLTPVGFIGDLAAERDDLPQPVAEFLDRHPQPVLITGGTGAFYGADFYAAALEAVAKLGLPAIVATRYREVLPLELSESTLHCERVSFGKLMPQLGVVIHHGGIGTTAAAVAAGVPQLILAYGLDRPDNGARIEHLGLGKVMAPPMWQPVTLAESLEHLLGSDDVASRCQTYAARTGEHDTAGEIIQTVNLFLAENRQCQAE